MDKNQYNKLKKLERQLTSTQKQVEQLDVTINKSRGSSWPKVQAKLRSSKGKKAQLLKQISDIKSEIQKNGGLEQLYSSPKFRKSKLKALNRNLQRLQKKLEALEKRKAAARTSKSPDIGKILMLLQKDMNEIKKQIQKVEQEIRKYGGSPT